MKRHWPDIDLRIPHNYVPVSFADLMRQERDEERKKREYRITKWMFYGMVAFYASAFLYLLVTFILWLF